MPDIKTQTKIAVLIEKINYLFSTIQQNNGALNKIDKDLMMNYVKELYELTLSLQVENQQAPPSYQPQQNQYSNQPNYPQQDNNAPNGYQQQQQNPQQQQPTQPQQPQQQQQFQPQQPAQPQPPQSAPQNGSNSSGNNNGTNNNGSNGNIAYPLKPGSEPVHGGSINQAYSGQVQRKTVADMYSIKTGAEKLSVNEKLNHPKAELADKLKKTPIKDLKVFIGLNKRFSYINFLFNNNALLYDEAIDKINNSRNYDEAMRYIEVDLLPKFKWHADDETVAEFYNIIERRFLV